MARRSSGLGSLIIVVAGVAFVGWAVKQFEDPGTRNAWLWTGGIIVTSVVGISILQRIARKRGLMAKYRDAEIVRRILTKQVWQGQTEEQLLDSLGRPADVDEQVMKTKTKRILKYGRTGKNRFRVRVTLEQGLVVGWEEKG